MSKDTIYRQDAINAIFSEPFYESGMKKRDADAVVPAIYEKIKSLPSLQPEVIRCNDCKHWTQSMGKMKGYGLGRCDFHDADLVTCNGFYYWAERRDNG